MIAHADPLQPATRGEVSQNPFGPRPAADVENIAQYPRVVEEAVQLRSFALREWTCNKLTAGACAVRTETEETVPNIAFSGFAIADAMRTFFKKLSNYYPHGSIFKE